MGKRKNLMKGAGQGIFIVLAILLSSVLSWGDTRLMVDQDATGSLTLTVWDGAVKTVASVLNAPAMSCGVPVIDWDSTLNSNAGGWVIFGSDASNPSQMWSGTVTCASYNPAVASCTYTNKTVVTAPSSCGTGFAIASSCLVSTAPLSTAVVANTVNGVCATPPNGATLTNAPTAGPSLCTVSGTGTSGAVITTANGYAWTCPGSGSPTGLTANCYAYLSAPTCVYTWSTTTCGGTCTPTSLGSATGTCSAAQTGVSPAGCIGGISTPPTISCNASVPTCTSWTYTAWSPSETTCTAGQTLTRSIVTSSPSGCTGGNPVLTESCPNSGGTGGTGSDPSTAINLKYNDPSTTWATFPIGPGGTKYFKAVQAGQCTSGYKQLVFDMLYQQTAPNLNFIVYKSGGSVPTAAGMYNEYVAMLAKYGYDSTSHLDGSYLFKFIGTQSGSGESTYLPSTFNQADTYYILAVNTSTSTSATFDMRYYCR